ncbi:uncharacterized protein N7469_008550 [Penicillium citrinum]|uniref:Uncharacterized protein n=1 Tax=Penicillium citrinum TaxID=5077 RepID=A0A9W9NLR1_PENCI|nr:uncharacterized protein N7469_008550 [Penicillium citrinum]KAJ5222310.1 hypothetical protein N7469_008550 [Penicillium citrinum]KAK5788897.1 hypothetical protein VI817_009855 [Penicillium citrinum]
MRLPRLLWTWSAFQVDTTLFMYGGTPAVCVPTEAFIQAPSTTQILENKTEGSSVKNILTKTKKKLRRSPSRRH